MIQKCSVFSMAFVICQLAYAQPTHDPTFEEVISLPSISNAVISPDGHHVIYEVQSADWKENRYDRELWLSKDGTASFQLTNGLKGSSNREVVAGWKLDRILIKTG